MKKIMLLCLLAIGIFALTMNSLPLSAQEENGVEENAVLENGLDQPLVVEEETPVDVPALTEAPPAEVTPPATPVEAVPPAAPWYEKHAQKAYLEVLDPMVDHAMKGYNDENHQVFFANYCKMMAGVATEMTFKNMVMNMFKAKTGAFKSKTLLDARCSFNETTPLLVYEGEFEKGKFLLPVNFTKEGDVFKVMQIQVQDITK